jgi:hypothetical protein
VAAERRPVSGYDRRERLITDREGATVSGGDVNWDELRPALQGLAKRLDYIEEHLVQMGRAVGYAYEPMNTEAPPEVRELMRTGKTLEAIRLYRKATGASLEQARAYVNSL